MRLLHLRSPVPFARAARIYLGHSSVNKIKSIVLGLVCVAAVAVANAQAALPADYAAIGTDADATFAWSKAFVIGVVTFLFVIGLIKLGMRRR